MWKKISNWAVIGLGVGLFLFVFIFTKPQNSTRNIDKHVAEYINNSIDIDIKASDLQSPRHEEIYTGLGGSSRRSVLSHVSCKHFIFYDENIHKYFKVYVIGKGGIAFEAALIYIIDELVTAKINRNQLNDHNYGTKENPIPILKFDSPQMHGRREYEEYFEMTQEEYERAFHLYLAYLMPKEEFRDRFGR